MQRGHQGSGCCASSFSVFIVCTLLVCGCGRSLAIKVSEESTDHTPYDFFSVSLIAEVIKFGFAATQLAIAQSRVASAAEGGDQHACLPDGRAGEEPGEMSEGQVILSGLKENIMFVVPALLFAISNNAMFVILTMLDPGTLAMIWNLKIVLTAVLLRCIGRVMNWVQLVGVMLLTVGVLISQAARAEDALQHEKEHSQYLTGVVLAFGSMCLVCLANVTTEWLYKRTHANQYRIVVNLVCLMARDGRKIIGLSLFDGYNDWTVLVILLTGCHGFVIGMTFKYLDNIVLVFCDVGMMVIVSIVSWSVWDLPLDATFVFGLILVAVATYLYYVQGTMQDPNSPTLMYAPLATSEKVEDHLDHRASASELENERI